VRIVARDILDQLGTKLLRAPKLALLRLHSMTRCCCFTRKSIRDDFPA
jgi:hypothetical protein